MLTSHLHLQNIFYINTSPQPHVIDILLMVGLNQYLLWVSAMLDKEHTHTEKTKLF